MLSAVNLAAAAFPAYLLYQEIADTSGNGTSVYRSFLFAAAIIAPIVCSRAPGNVAKLAGLALSVGIVTALVAIPEE